MKFSANCNQMPWMNDGIEIRVYKIYILMLCAGERSLPKSCLLLFN